jgi:hypothetical protein
MNQTEAPKLLNVLLGELGYRNLGHYCAANGYNYGEVYSYLRGARNIIPKNANGDRLPDSLKDYEGILAPNAEKGAKMRKWILANSNVRNILSGRFLIADGTVSRLCRILKLDPETFDALDGRPLPAETWDVKYTVGGKKGELSGSLSEVMKELGKLKKAPKN